MTRLRRIIAAAIERWKRSLPGSVLGRYSSRHGGLLANGLAYGLLFAFFAGLWTVLSIAGLVVAGNVGIQRALLESLEGLVPGIAHTVGQSGALNRISGTLTWTGVVTLVSFLWSVIGWMDSLRAGVQTMFDDDTDQTDAVRAKLRDVLAVVAVVVLLMLSTTAGAVSGGVMRMVLRATGVPAGSPATSALVDIAGFLVGFLFNVALLLILLRVVAHIRHGRATMEGAMLGALAFSMLQLLGARLLGGASSNPLLAPFAAIIGVLLWFNLMAQVMLYCAAFIAERRVRHGDERGRSVG
ncbi:YihY/virulence factor BrkB family protein [Bifidobacterium mongoliense]|uniref:YihY/virulence factor BrkB family protein n=1 Tax=Bifidobacterium mongoliense TaxID=518643 RepID=UPI0030EBC09C